MSGWDWWAMTLMMVVGFVIIVAALVLVTRETPPRNAGQLQSSPLEILARRFAKGEIDGTEYKRRRDALQH